MEDREDTGTEDVEAHLLKDGRVPEGDQRVPEGDRRVPEGDQRDEDFSLHMLEGDNRVPEGDERVPEGDQRVPEGDATRPRGRRAAALSERPLPFRDRGRKAPVSSCQETLETTRIVVRSDHGGVEAAVDEITCNALQVVWRDAIERREDVRWLARASLENLALQGVIDDPLRRLQREDEPALGVVPRLVELLLRHGLVGHLPELLDDRRNRIVDLLGVERRPAPRMSRRPYGCGRSRRRCRQGRVSSSAPRSAAMTCRRRGRWRGAGRCTGPDATGGSCERRCRPGPGRSAWCRA